MKSNRIFKTSDSSLNWQTIMNEASNYKYVVMYRDHYQGNGKGEFFAADRLAALMEEQPYWFSNEDRPVYEVILTDEDIPKIIADRQKVIDQIQTAEYTMSKLSRPVLNADRRSTRRTQPEAWAEYDKAVEAYNADRSALELAIAGLRAALKVIPYHSTTLLQLN
jgi:hypothetical protein